MSGGWLFWIIVLTCWSIEFQSMTCSSALTPVCFVNVSDRVCQKGRVWSLLYSAITTLIAVALPPLLAPAASRRARILNRNGPEVQRGGVLGQFASPYLLSPRLAASPLGSKGHVTRSPANAQRGSLTRARISGFARLASGRARPAEYASRRGLPRA